MDKVVTQGLDPDLTTSILNKWEFYYNDKFNNGAKRGFNLGFAVVDNWMFPELSLKKDLDFTIHSERLTILECIHEKGKLGFPVVVFHGTDTMVDPAELYAAAHSNPTNPLVVFTGAMAPLGFEGSDAAQNIADALLAVRLLGSEVYVSFQNRILPVPGAVKNYRLRTFEMG